MPDLRVAQTDRFKQDAQDLLGDRWEVMFPGLEWELVRKGELGQRVVGTDVLTFPIYPNDGHVYVAYYRVAGEFLTLLSMTKRRLPVSPQVLDLET